MTLEELKIEAKKEKNKGEFETALILYTQLWEQEKNEWNGYYLAQCLRKIENFEDARKLHIELELTYPYFKPLKNEKLWLDYSQKVKSSNNPNFVTDANEILERADKYDKYTSSVYAKTVLHVVKYFIQRKNYVLAYEWLLKLDQTVISNSIFKFKGQIFPADRKVFFVRYADVLILLHKHINYIENCLKNLNFKESKQLEYKEYIVSEITFNDYISRVKLARHIKNFQEEYHLRAKSIPKINYDEKKTTLISDLSHYLFCPVSFAINETYLIEANSSWEKDEWLGEKKLFIDRYKLFQKTKSFEVTFEDSEIEITQQIKSDFIFLFNSELRVDNATNPHPTIYSNNSGDLKGAPDYVMQNDSKTKFAITEKFTNINSVDSKTPFESDLVKHYAFIEKLEKAEISFGYLITWYWKLKDIETINGSIKKKIVISSYRLTKVDINENNSNKLDRVLKQVNSFKANKTMDLDGDKISFANKCLNCSVVSYCNHKTGNFNKIVLPYDLGLNIVLVEPKIEF